MLIIVDSLRSDHLSCCGYEKKTTPFIDEISNEGIIFQNAISPGAWTKPSFYSIYTGLYPSKAYSLSNSDQFHTIADILHAHGYRTIAVTGCPFLAWHELTKGFDSFNYLTKWSAFKSLRLKTIPKLISHAIRHKFIPNKRFFGGFLINQLAERWLDSSSLGKPFFMLLHYSVHFPYDPPKPNFDRFLDNDISIDEVKNLNQDVYDLIANGKMVSEKTVRALKGLYDGMINYIDDCLRDLLDYFKAVNVFNDTLLIITSDHGELFGEHGLFFHHFVLYDELIKVPLIIRFPDQLIKGERFSDLVQTLDILPTLIDYLGIEAKDVSKEIEGYSLLKLIEGKEKREFTISERFDSTRSRAKELFEFFEKNYPNFDLNRYDHELIALRTKRHKYIWSSKGKDELYNLESDPKETKNIISIEPKKAENLRRKLIKWSDARAHALKPTKLAIQEMEFDESLKKRLRALGYL